MLNLGLFSLIVFIMYHLTLTDETIHGSILNLLKLKVDNDPLSVRDLIKLRVYQEVKAYNSQRVNCFRGLVEPSKAERVLNGYILKPWRKIDPEQQFISTLKAFKKGLFRVCINGEVIEDLNEWLLPEPLMRISFLKA